MNWKKIRRIARRWARQNRLSALILTLVVIAGAILLVIPGEQQEESPVVHQEDPQEKHRDEYEEFLDALAEKESSDNYTVVNRFGYMGRYQIGKLGLQEAGFMDRYGNWTKLANSYGIYSRADFLNSPAGQDAAIRAYHEQTCYYIKALGLDKYIGSTYCGVTVTRSGLLAACHLVGVSAMKKGLATGRHMYDGFHVSAAFSMEHFAGYDVSSVWDA